MGDGPLYPFFIPYHLVHFETPTSIARVALFRDAARPAARRSGGRGLRRREDETSRPGDVLDDYGMYMTYGEAVNAGEMSAEPLPARGTRRRLQAASATSPRTRCITYDDVELPPNRARRPAACRAVPALPERDLACGSAPGGGRA